MALALRNLRSIVTLRQPSLAPVFGIKGGGAGGGKWCVLPSDEINLHFTGDLHAVAAANNLLAAMVDNHCKRGLIPLIPSSGISWRRVVDINDKGLAEIESGVGNVPQAPRRLTGFDLTAASEVLSVLATSLDDLRSRLGRMIVARTSESDFVTAEQIGAAGAMTALLRNALRPNLVQTSEHTPAIVHAGPFANISHGNSSVIGDLAALGMADYVVTESGFGSDLGAEKLFNLKCQTSGLRPSAEVLICTVVRPSITPVDLMSAQADRCRTRCFGKTRRRSQRASTTWRGTSRICDFTAFPLSSPSIDSQRTPMPRYSY